MIEAEFTQKTKKLTSLCYLPSSFFLLPHHHDAHKKMDVDISTKSTFGTFHGVDGLELIAMMPPVAKTE
jgi:hypothetical protein